MALTFKSIFGQSEPEKQPTLIEVGVDAKKAADVRDYLRKITHDKRLPGSDLEGASRVFTGLLSGMQGAEAADKEKLQREMLIAQLRGTDGFDPLTESRLAIGDTTSLSDLAKGRQAQAARDIQFAQAKELLATKLAARREAAAKSQAAQAELYGKIYGSGAAPGAAVTPPMDGAPKMPDGSTPPVDAGRFAKENAKNLSKYLAELPQEKRAAYNKLVGTDKMIDSLSVELGALEEKTRPIYKKDSSGKPILVNGKPVLSTRDMLPETSVGFLGQILSEVGGTDAASVKSYLNRVLGKAAFAQLNEMKDAAKTGASGLGQVTEKEIELLKTAWGSLSQDMKRDDFRKGLKQVLDSVGRLKEYSRIIYKDQFGDIPKSLSDTAQPSAPGKMRFDKVTGDVVPAE